MPSRSASSHGAFTSNSVPTCPLRPPEEPIAGAPSPVKCGGPAERADALVGESGVLKGTDILTMKSPCSMARCQVVPEEAGNGPDPRRPNEGCARDGRVC